MAALKKELAADILHRIQGLTYEAKIYVTFIGRASGPFTTKLVGDILSLLKETGHSTQTAMAYARVIYINTWSAVATSVVWRAPMRAALAVR